MHGQFSWYDLMTPDASAAKKFYPAVAGWGTEQWDKADYMMWTTGGAPFAGTNPITPEQTAQGIGAHWLAYVTVDDVDSSANRVRSLGGKVLHGPEDIPEVGRYAIIADPQGAMLAIFKSNTPSPGWDGTPTPGRFSWHELMTTDASRAMEFYRQLFGWEKTSEYDMGPSGIYYMYGKQGKPFGGMYTREAERANVPPSWTFYVNVANVDRAAAAVKQHGGKVMVGPMDVPGGGRVAIAVDAQGATFAVHQTKAKAAAKKVAGRKAKAPKRKAAAKSARKTPAKRRAATKAKRGRAKPKPRAKAKGRSKKRSR